ncbi:MAG TPA: ParB/RepB/Spo0J family partition protein [Acidimicrobiales bacterium]|nr:ParB/RepB/Spo0J family partition protein [Acidimicrobiales bacterium]
MSSRRSGLGRGLSALIPTEVASESTSALVELPVTSLRPNPDQPREHFDEETLASLSASIRELGVLQPVLVKQAVDGSYELIAGERRLRAAKRAGLTTIPAIVRDADRKASLEQALVENLHRQDLNALEEAAAYSQLIEDLGLTHEQVATRVGKSRVSITNSLRLFQLPPSVQKLVASGELSGSHAKALLGTPDRGLQEVLAKRAVAEDMSVRAVEEAVKATAATPAGASAEVTPTAPRGSKGRLPEPGVAELERLLSDHLDTRVKVDLGAKRSSVVIEFADLDDLERIYLRMTSAS